MNRLRTGLLTPLLLLFACRSGDLEGAATGTVELTETDVAPLTPARVLRVCVEEGAVVSAGDTLVILTQSNLPPELETRRARVASAEAEVRDLRAGARRSELDRARSELAAASEDATRARRDADRYRALLQSGSVGQAQADAMETSARVAEQRVVTARESVQLLADGARPERIRSAEGALRQARAQLASLEASATDLVLLAPHDGVVLGRHVEPGEVLGAGVPAISLGDPRRPWVRVYVSPAQLERLNVGDAVTIQVTGGSGPGYPATIVALNPAAEFTPRVAMTETERADLLFGVKLAITDTTGRIKAGLPVSVRLGAAPASP